MASGITKQPIRVLVMNKDNKRNNRKSGEYRSKQQSNNERTRNNHVLHTFMPGNDRGMFHDKWYHQTTTSGVGNGQ